MGGFYQYNKMGQDSGYEIALAHMKIEKAKRIETYILISGIIIIGYLWIWALAIWWLWTSRRVEEEFIRIWKRHSNFEGNYPFQRGFFEIITEDPVYRQKLTSKNSLKNFFMWILAIPFLGYVFVLIGTFLTIGILWIFYFSEMQKPNKYLKQSVEGSRMAKVTEFVAPQKGGKVANVSEISQTTSTSPATSHSPPFYCQLCGVKHIAGTPRMQCDNCGRYVCVEAFAESAKVGRVVCPMCDGRLVPI
ncbi:MAG: PHD finger domain-containing protein [Candidatus Heimdallarchaeota archaeon]